MGARRPVKWPDLEIAQTRKIQILIGYAFKTSKSSLSDALVAIFGIYARFCGEWWHREPLGQFWGLVSVGLCVAPSGGGVAPKFYQKMVSPNIATLPKIQKTFCAQKMDFLSIGQKDAQGSVSPLWVRIKRVWARRARLKQLWRFFDSVAWLHRAVAWLHRGIVMSCHVRRAMT